MKSVDLMSLCTFVKSVHLCFSVRNRTSLEPLESSFSHKGHFFSLTELTDLTERIAHSFEPTERLRHTDITERYN